jgi:hypothetical protein
MRRAGIGVLVVAALLAASLAVSHNASAVAFTGGVSPTIYGSRADLNGDGVVTGRDDSNQFYGSTHIIDGRLDCDGWGGENDGAAGDNVIDGDDVCVLIGYDGTGDGVEISVFGGQFELADGNPIPNGRKLPTVFPNPMTPNNPDVGDSRFAWSTIGGRVDSNGDEAITGDDCHFGIIGQTNDDGLGEPKDGADVLGASNACGFVSTPSTAENGLVDLNSDEDISSADTCTNGCFLGHNVTLGFVQAEGTNPTPSPTPSPTASPSPSPAPPLPPGGSSLVIGDGGSNVTRSQDCRYTVTLSPASTETVRVNFAAGATNSAQIAPTTGTLVFAPGETTKTIVVDVLKRRRKTAAVEATLSGASGATITDGVGRCTIKKKRRNR